MEEDILITLFKIWAQYNPSKLQDKSPSEIVEAWFQFQKEAKKKWKELNPPGPVKAAMV